MKSETKIGLRKDAYKALILTVAVMVIRGISSLSSIDGSVNIVAVLVAVPMVFAFMLGVLTLYRRLTKSKS
jgi:hypothetical protein